MEKNYMNGAEARKSKGTKGVSIRGRILFVMATLLCCGNFLLAQPLETPQLVQPLLWLKSDSSVLGASHWQDISGNGHHAVPQSGALPAEFARLNFNKAFFVEDEYFTVSGLPFANRTMTGMVVYRLADTAERGIWETGTMTEGKRVGLTSRRLLGEKGDITYRDSNDRITIVHTLFRNWDGRDSLLLSNGYAFELMRADSLPFYGRVSECLLFNWAIDDTTLIQYISYLSLKYGITLFETDYLSSDKRMVWDYHNNPDFSYSIAGLGRDERLGLYQKQSYMLDDRIVIGLNELAATNEDNNGILENGEYLIWGFDSSLLARNGMIYLDNGEEFEVYGNGLFQGTKDEGTNARSTFMTVNGTGWQGTIDNYYLLIDRSGTGAFRPEEVVFYVPDYVDTANILHFSNIEWDTDGNGTDRFCFTYVPVDSILQNRNLVMNNGRKTREEERKNGERANGTQRIMNDERANDEREKESARLSSFTVKVYPNPSEGDFILDIDFSQKTNITVKLFTPEGKELDRKHSINRKNYRFNYHLSVAGHYLLEVNGGKETKTAKVVIVR